MSLISESLRKLSHVERMQLYALYTKPVLNTCALFADESCNYVTPQEPEAGDSVSFRFRTGRDNADRVFLCVEGQRLEMDIIKSTGRFDYYETEYVIGKKTFSWYFEIQAGDRCFYYNKKGPGRQIDHFFDFSIAPGFSSPEWAKGAVMYQIYVDRFANGDLSNDVTDREYMYINEPVWHIHDWTKFPDAMDVRNFYGGDLQGVLDHLDYLQDLGVDAIYLNPIFVSPSNHKYDIQDYDYVDPHYGKIVKDEGWPLPEWEKSNTAASKYICRVTDKENLEASNAFFISFVEEIHRRGMKVILDGVFNHCGSFNKWMDAERIYEHQPGYEKGAFVSEHSPYRHFFKFYSDNGWPYNGDYDGWWGHKTLPKLNYEESEKLTDYILEIGKKWVSPPFNVDGWRLDVAADLGQSEAFNHKFWKRFRKAVKKANPDAIILAEHYGDPSSWLKGDEWDTVMNYNAFMEPVTWFLTGMEKHSDERRPDLKGNGKAFRDAMEYHMSLFKYSSLEVAMNELSNHDHSRFLTRTNMKVGRTDTLGPQAADEDCRPGVMRSAVVMQMTWPGAPTVYYGDEAGLTGWTDPDNRRTYPWGREDWDMIHFHKEMIRIHKSRKALMRGSLKMLKNQDGYLAYARFTEEEQIVVVVSSEEEQREIRIPVWEAGVADQGKMEYLMRSTSEGWNTEKKFCPVVAGEIHITLPPLGSVVLLQNKRHVPELLTDGE